MPPADPRYRRARRCAAGPGGRAALTLAFLALVLGCFSERSPAQNPPTLWGRPVRQIRLICDCNLKLGDFPGEVIQQAGEPLDPAKVSDSLKRLYATGRFRDLRAEGTPEGDGVSLTFAARAQYFIGIVRATGSPGSLEARDLVAATRLRLGRPLNDEDLQAAQKQLSDLLAANGYYQSKIKPQIRRFPETLQANVNFSVEAGEPARLSTVQFPANAGFSPERLMKVSGWRPRTYLTAVRLERGLYRLHQFYVNHGHLEVNVSIQKRTYDAKTNTEKLIVKTDAGPLVRVRVQGASISTSRLQNLLPLYHDGVTDDAALARSEQLLEDYYQKKGFFTTSVKASRATLRQPEPHLRILFSVKLGVRGEFAGYGVKGNKAIPTPELMAAITPPVQGLFPPLPTYSRDQVEQKVSVLVALYQSRGFLEATVTPDVIDNYENFPGRRYVRLVIDEGARTTVHALTIEGISTAIQNQIWPSLVSKPSQPYSLQGVRADHDRILDYLANHGYTRAEVSWQTTPAKSAHQVDLEFHLASGIQDRIQSIVIMGNQHTRPGLVRRQLLFHEGEPISQSSVLESQRRLYDLGIFNQVQITPQEGSVANPDKTMLVSLEESRRWVLGYGGGFDVQKLGSNQPQGQYKASPRLSLDITRLNVGGRGQTFSMGGRLSDIDTGANIGYLISRLFNRDDLSLRLNSRVDRSRDVLTFTADRKEASLSVEKRFSASTFLIGEYDFRRVVALDISSKVSQEENFLLSQPALVGMVDGSFIADHRDDPSDATRGVYTLVNAGVSWRDLGSQANFVRFTGQNSTYHRLNSFLVFARKTQFGVLSPYGSPYSITIPASNGQPAQEIFTSAIPLPERFFMGGSESMRGFSINQAGPRDPETGFPIGGNALFFNSFELRASFAQRRIGLVLFQDSGNVYSSIRFMRLFKFTQSSPEDFNYTSHAVGIGLRYKTPLGPIRLDVGYNLNPPRYNVVTNSGGTSVTEVQQLPRVQFFLSFGQSF